MKENTVFPGSIGAMIEPIIQAVLSVRSQGGDLVHNSVRADVSRTVNRLQTMAEPWSAPLGVDRIKPKF